MDMFGSLKRWLWSALDKTLWFAQESLKQAWAFCKSTWGTVLIASGWLWTMASQWKGGIGDVVDAIQEIVIPNIDTNASGISATLAICNRFLPLSEMFLMLAAYLSLVTGISLYRIAKKYLFGMS